MGVITLRYFDNAATSWPKPEEVYEAVNRTLRQGGNAGRGVNAAALGASRTLYSARRSIASLFGIPDAQQVVFTQNVTEALNLALYGLLSPGDHVLASSLEHNAVMRPLEDLKGRGVAYDLIPCSMRGELDLQSLIRNIKPETRLICLTHASNVLGNILPIQEVGRIAREHGVFLLVDAAQTAGLIPIDVQRMGIDLLAFTGHKGLFGPQGTGGLFVREGIRLRPLIHGGTGSHSALLQQPENMPDIFESGTRNLPGIAGLDAGVRFITHQGLERIREHELRLMAILLEGLLDLGAEVLGPLKPEERVGLVACNFTGWEAGEICILLDREYQTITRAGLHCAPLAHRTAGTINSGALRISPGFFHTPDQVEELLKILGQIMSRR